MTNQILTCPYCGNTKEVLKYYAKVGGSDELILQIHCTDLAACINRQLNSIRKKLKPSKVKIMLQRKDK